MAQIDTAMVLAAGFGKRMRPLTDKIPKPLVPLNGTPLIDWTMARLRAGGVQKFIVNSHYLGEQIEAHFKSDIDVTLSPEESILDTGGGIARALPLLGNRPFFAANADTVWLDGVRPATSRMAQSYDSEKMDVLLLLHPVAAAGGDYAGSGDFMLAPSGKAIRREENGQAPYLFAGLSILNPGLFQDTPQGAFSLNKIFDKAAKKDRLYGLVHDGAWYHVGTPEALRDTEKELRLA